MISKEIKQTVLRKTLRLVRIAYDFHHPIHACARIRMNMLQDLCTGHIEPVVMGRTRIGD
jgi:hypothetical protein